MMQTKTANGADCLTKAGATAAHAGRGAALSVMSLNMNGPRFASSVEALTKEEPAVKAGVTLDALQAAVADVLSECEELGGDDARQNLVDLFAMAFDTGDVREGKGERMLFVYMLLELVKVAPRTVYACVPLVVEYASFRTLNLLYAGSLAAAGAAGEEVHARALLILQETIVKVYTDQLLADKTAVDAATGGKPVSVSLAGKWAPRVGSSRLNRPLAKALRDKLFPVKEATPAAASWASSQYRKLVAGLTAHLGVVETKMCAGKWAEIVPTHVPSLALKRYRKALRNVAKDGKTMRMDNGDRKACATNFEEAAAAAVADPTNKATRLKGSGNAPHQLVETCLRGDADPIIEAAWLDLVHTMKEKGAFKSMVPIVDVSGSMTCNQGMPLRVAISIGLLVSELSAEPFAGRVLTFSSDPTWHVLPEGGSLSDRVQSLQRAPWGMTTNFELAMDRVLELCVAHRLPQEAIPEAMIVLSDMQFDAAKGGHPFAADLIKAKFAKHDYTAPHIMFWNLAASKLAFQAETTTPGVSFMSGVSQNVLSAFFEEGPEALTDVREPTPWEVLQARLQRPRLDAVRAVCAAVGEGPMAGYVVPERKEEPAAGAGGDEEDVM